MPTLSEQELIRQYQGAFADVRAVARLLDALYRASAPAATRMREQAGKAMLDGWAAVSGQIGGELADLEAAMTDVRIYFDGHPAIAAMIGAKAPEAA